MLKKLSFSMRVLGFIALLCLVTTVVSAKNTLIIGLQDDAATLDPAKSVETAAAGLISQMYDTLVGFAEDDISQIVPKLASSWEVKADGKTWIFHLRRGILFASGNPINADAVVFTLHRSLKLGSWILSQFGITENSVMKLDEYTVQIELEQQYAPGLFLSCLASPFSSSILDYKLVMEHEQDDDMGSAWLEEHSAGSGPYALQMRRREGPTEYVLTANEHYWGEKPQFTQIIVRGIQEPVEQMLMLERGELDIAWNLQPEQVQILGTNPDIQVLQTQTLYDVYVLMNVGYPPLQNSDVRDAIRYAIDYDGLIEFVLQGTAVKHQSFIPKGLLGHNPSIPYMHDSEKAKQLLAQAGYSEGFDVELKCLNYSPWVDIAMKVKSDLAEIGINVSVVQLTPEEMVEALFSRETQFWLWEFGTDYADPDAKAKSFAHSDSLGEDATVKWLAWAAKYVNLETSTLVEQAARELDPQKRADLYKQVTEIILDDGPFAMLFTKVHQYGVRTEVVDSIRKPDMVVIPFPQLK